MANVFPLPMNVPINVSDSYQRQNTLLYAQMAGHLSISLSNMASTAAPKVLAGSVFELNGVLFKVEADESVSESPATGQNYIYAVPGTGSASFQYSTVKPVWDAVLNGWYYSGSSTALLVARAVAKVYCDGTNYNNKVLLDSYKAMYEMNNIQPMPTTGGVLIVNAPVNSVASATLDPGWYRYEVKAGSGGTGGNGGNGGNTGGGQNGLPPTNGQVLNGIWEILCRETFKITSTLGGDGNNGGNGTNGENGSSSAYPTAGGGAGGAGGGSYATIKAEIIRFTKIIETISIDSFTIGGNGGNGGDGITTSGSYSEGGKGGRGGIGTYTAGGNGFGGENTYWGAAGGKGGAGGTLKSTSSGYSRIYRMA
jgi:hypothetical protein